MLLQLTGLDLSGNPYFVVAHRARTHLVTAHRDGELRCDCQRSGRWCRHIMYVLHRVLLWDRELDGDAQRLDASQMVQLHNYVGPSTPVPLVSPVNFLASPPLLGVSLPMQCMGACLSKPPERTQRTQDTVRPQSAQDTLTLPTISPTGHR